VQGPSGAQGPAGSKGETGAGGAQGPAGPQGPAGQNGTTGFTETLPEGKTLEGEWSLAGILPGTQTFEGSLYTSVSFGIPLKEAPEVSYIPAPTEKEEEKGEFPTPPFGCTGNVDEPGAEAGHLCVFSRFEHNIELVHICSASTPIVICGAENSSDRFGFQMDGFDDEKGLVIDNGTWAVAGD
jgi:hypothetical protein